ncbi:MAG TPA: hypothetical protein PLJ00_14965 [Chitinophagales bacterium]|nr:hypothetical protein [Chitinophagales bacterium]HRH55234.1 hypothetical protein [Chitinophagales bacterium]
MKSTGVIFQDFSIAGLKKQWEYQQFKIKCNTTVKDLPDPGFNMPEKYKKDAAWCFPIPKVLQFGCKTETRRTRGLDEINEEPDRWSIDVLGEIQGNFAVCMRFDNKPTNTINIKCPYGVVGDEIWVKETYRKYYFVDENGYTHYDREIIEYAADNPPMIKEVDADGRTMYDNNGREKFIKWKSPVFMPKAACRIKLEVSGISIERLHQITDEGALREGIVGTKLPDAFGGGVAYNIKGNYISALDIEDNATGAYKWTWISLHGQESWNKNPWVWVIQFTVKEFKQ